VSGKKKQSELTGLHNHFRKHVGQSMLNFDDPSFPPDIEEDDDPNDVHCKYCKKGGFHWKVHHYGPSGKEVFRLYDSEGQLHSCNEYFDGLYRPPTSTSRIIPSKKTTSNGEEKK
jgi:hypothetical protein